MDKNDLKNLIEVAAGRRPADLLIKNCKIVDLGAGQIRLGQIAITGPYIAGILFDDEIKDGLTYEAKEVIDAHGFYASPGLMDAHIHIESSYLTPEEFGRLVVPFGTTSVIADPHEIANVAGLEGFHYMQKAAEKTALKIEYLLPSCVPSTSFETAGAVLKAADLRPTLAQEQVLGLAELMNFPGVVNCDEDVLDKVLAAKDLDKLIDGHSPGLSGKDLNAYAAVGILADHECSSPAEASERLSKGMHIMLRQGSSCHDLAILLEAVNDYNYTRCLLCSDDRHAETILDLGHMNNHLQICVRHGLSPIQAIRMASLNIADAFGLKDRGGIFPGYKADIVLFKDLENFEAKKVFIDGKLVAEDGKYLLPVERANAEKVRNSFHLGDFREEKLELKVKSNKVRIMEIMPGGVVTKAGKAEVEVDSEGRVILREGEDLVYMGVVERHLDTGNVGLGLLKGYGLKKGAIATSIAHDSHNIMVTGRNTRDMALAVEELAKQEGGIILVKDGKVLDRLALPIAGLMSAGPAEDLARNLSEIQELAHSELGVSKEIDPIMTLSFMSLAVIPELKLTDFGLFDVVNFKLVDIETEM